MYEQVEKQKENKRKTIANSPTQKKSGVKQGFGFVDNRPEEVAQRKPGELINDSKQLSQRSMQMIQTKTDDTNQSGYPTSQLKPMYRQVVQLFNDGDLTYQLYYNDKFKEKIDLLCKRFDCGNIFTGKKLPSQKGLWVDDWKIFFKKTGISQEAVTLDNFKEVLEAKKQQTAGKEEEGKKAEEKKQKEADIREKERERQRSQDQTVDRDKLPAAERKKGATIIDMGWFGIGIQPSENEPMETYGVTPCVALGIKETQSNIIVLAHFHSENDVKASVSTILAAIRNKKNLEYLNLVIYIAGGKRQYGIGQAPKGQLDGPELFQAISREIEANQSDKLEISQSFKWHNAQGEVMDLQMTSDGLRLLKQ